jgi:hypothetical protein
VNGQRRVQISPMIMNVAVPLTLADVGTRHFLAHRADCARAGSSLISAEARRRRRPHADPVRLLEPLGGDDLIGMRRSCRRPCA